MSAYLQTSLKHGFYITEESLIKLDDIIRRRLLAYSSDVVLTSKVYRLDGMLVEFESAGNIAKEENSSRNSILRIDLLSNTPTYNLSLSFYSKTGTVLQIAADDRDLAYLLASDIKEYLHSEVLKFRSFTFSHAFSSRFIFPLLMLPMILLVTTSFKDGPQGYQIQQILASTDLNEKMNFLIEARTRQDPRYLKWYMIGLFFTIFGLMFIGGWLDKVYPRNVFYLGKQIASYDKLLKNREKFWWGIIVAFVIGIASTVAVDFFKPSPPISQKSLID